MPAGYEIKMSSGQSGLDTHQKRALSPDDNGTDNTTEGVKHQRTLHGRYRCLQSRGKGQTIRLQHSAYTVGWICALHIEMAASLAMLDQIHEDLPTANDSNSYILGSIGEHNVVMACLPAGQYGTNNAATVAGNMMRSFPKLELRFMVGIGGGAPDDVDIRLGDIVVGKHVIQHDMVKVFPDQVQRTAIPRLPPPVLLNAVSKLRALHETTASQVPSFLERMHERHPNMADYGYPASCDDRLFKATYHHVIAPNCTRCSLSELQHRPHRPSPEPKIHYGGVASGNQLMKSGITRNTLAQSLDVICFEMEAAGLIDSFPCLVIRGICDYADSHKDARWQKYAAATAAAYAKELLDVITPRAATSPSPPCSLKCPVENVQEKLQARRKDLLESLRFDQLDARHATIKRAHSQTCEWLLQEPIYKDWLDPAKAAQRYGFLWISGKPGAGKSTLMKFLFNRARRASKAGTATLSFFFNARGNSLEKSTLGLYRSILLQLLETFCDVQAVLDDLVLIPLNQTECPPVETLQELFCNAVMLLGERRLTCFVDALDECDEEQVQEMVAFFEELGMINGVQLKTCFSSRHYPHIDIRNGLRLVIEDQPGHSRDLERFVQSQLGIVKDPLAKKIRASILDKAGGVFMWVVVVVDLLNKEIRRGRMFAIEKTLREIPNELSDLFKEILKRDNENMDDLLLCIQWILFAERPLSRQEFYFAMSSGLPGYNEVPVSNDSDLVTNEAIDLFVTSSSKGLAEITKSKSKTVQFIHESVKDFLIKDKGFQELWPDLGDAFQSLSHEKLKHCCLSYIAPAVFSQIASTNCDPPPKANSEQAKGIRQKASEKFPFLGYATTYVLHHANLATEALSQLAFLHQFPLEDWVRLNNILEKHEIRRYNPTVIFPYILAEKNYVGLLEEYVQHYTNIHVQGERYGFPLFAALANNHRLAARALLGRVSMSLSNKDIFPFLDYKGWFDSRVDAKLDPLRWALENRHTSLTKLLAMSGHFDLKRIDHRRRSIIHSAAIGGDADALAFLTETAADGRSQVFDETNEPSVATDSSLVVTRIDRLWLRRQINLKDKEGKTPLMHAVKRGCEDVTRILLHLGADVRAKTSYSELGGMEQTSLSMAAEEGHEHIVRLLLESGSDIEAKDYFGGTPIFHAVRNGHLSTIKILISRGSAIDSRCNLGQSLLHVAPNMEIAKVLVESGADVNKKDDSGSSPLHRAAILGEDVILKYLVENGAYINARDASGATALHVALRKSTIKLLIESGVSIEAKDSDGNTALHRAVTGFNSEAIKLLIESGADAKCVNRNGQTPFDIAVAGGGLAMIKAFGDLQTKV